MLDGGHAHAELVCDGRAELRADHVVPQSRNHSAACRHVLAQESHAGVDLGGPHQHADAAAAVQTGAHIGDAGSESALNSRNHVPFLRWSRYLLARVPRPPACLSQGCEALAGRACRAPIVFPRPRNGPLDGHRPGCRAAARIGVHGRYHRARRRRRRNHGAPKSYPWK